MALSEEGIALECFNCGSIQFICFDLPEPVPPAGSQVELAVTCDICNRPQWMTLTIKARDGHGDGGS